MGTRGGRTAIADVGRAVARGAKTGGGATRARGSRGRCGRDVPPDVSGGGDRLACVRAPRSGPGADLLGLRRTGRVGPPGRCRGKARRHRRRLLPTRSPRPDEGGPRRRARRRTVGRARGRLAPGGWRLPDECGARRLVGRRSCELGWIARAGRGRQRGALPPRLHVGNDGKAEGCAPRPGRVPGLDRARGRLSGRPARGRPRALLHRHGLDHGSVDGDRRDGVRRDRRLHGGRAGLAPRPPLEARRRRST